MVSSDRHCVFYGLESCIGVLHWSVITPGKRSICTPKAYNYEIILPVLEYKLTGINRTETSGLSQSKEDNFFYFSFIQNPKMSYDGL